MFGRLIMLATIVAMLALPQFAGATVAGEGTHWVCEDRPMMLAERVPEFPALIGGAGEPMPPGAIALAGVDLKRRTLDLWLYPGDVRRRVSLDALYLEHERRFLSGRFDPMQTVVVTKHGDEIKLFIPNWPGDSGGPVSIYRVATGCRWR